jgi:ABC-type transport system substrate-binding protein
MRASHEEVEPEEEHPPLDPQADALHRHGGVRRSLLLNARAGAWHKQPVRLLSIAALATILAACGRQRTESPLTLRVAVVGTLEKLSAAPLVGFSSVAQDWVYEPLARVAEDGSLYPVLAASMETLPGGRMRFRLRTDAYFSDGSKVTSDDVARSLRRAHLEADVENGDLVVSGGGGASAPLIPFAPIWRAEAEGELGTGPYVVREQSPTRILLARRQHVPHRFDFIEMKAYTTPREALARTLKGEADLLLRVEPRLAEFFDNVKRLRIVRGRTTQAAAVAMNLSLPREVRRRVATTLPSAEIARAAFGESCMPLDLPRAGAEPIAIRRLDVLVPILDVGYERLGYAVRRALGREGGEVRLKPGAEFIKALRAGQYDLLVSPIQNWPPAAAWQLFRTGSARNIWHYSNAAVDAAIDAEDWSGTEKAFAENPAAVFVCLQERLFAIDARIKNPRMGATAPLELLPEWEVTE